MFLNIWIIGVTNETKEINLSPQTVTKTIIFTIPWNSSSPNLGNIY